MPIDLIPEFTLKNWLCSGYIGVMEIWKLLFMVFSEPPKQRQRIHNLMTRPEAANRPRNLQHFAVFYELAKQGECHISHCLSLNIPHNSPYSSPLYNPFKEFRLWLETCTTGGMTYLWLAENEGMEKRMETIKLGLYRVLGFGFRRNGKENRNYHVEWVTWGLL